MKYLGDSKFQLSGGRYLYAHRGVLGVSASEGSKDTLFNGYDGEVSEADPPLTADEKREISDYMIALWWTWAEMAK